MVVLFPTYIYVFFTVYTIDHNSINRSLPHMHTLTMDLKKSIRKQTRVSTKLATHLLSTKYPDYNVVFSPLSMHVALSVLAAGSKGQTLDEILGFLKANTTDDLNSLYRHLVPLIFADGSPKGGPRLCFADGVWVEKTVSLKSSFKQVLDTVYKADCYQVDFENKAAEVVDEVNLWVDKQTKGLIKQLLPANALDDNTRLVFTNAVYFKGSWSEKFDRSRTREFDFNLLNGNKVQVPFMTSWEDQLVCEYDDFKVLGLPYLQGQDNRQFTMYIFLPDAKDGLRSLVEKMGSTSHFLSRHIPRKRVEVGRFLIPKFKISFGFEASRMLNELGLVLPFVPGNVLTEMVDSRDGQGLFLSNIRHKCFVEVNEEGTEAAAVTEMDMVLGCCAPEYKPEPVNFVADHPFLFVIREDVSRVVLFMGQVMDPRVG